MSLMFAGLSVGEVIKAYDFMPRKEVDDMFVIGEIKDMVERHGALFYAVSVLFDSTGSNREEVLVPLETTFDFKNRVTRA